MVPPSVLGPLYSQEDTRDTAEAAVGVGREAWSVRRGAWSVISLRSAKTRMGRQIVGWWRRPQARKERSSPAPPRTLGIASWGLPSLLRCEPRERYRDYRGSGTQGSQPAVDWW